MEPTGYTRSTMSSGVAAVIAHVAFWVLLGFGWFAEEVGRVGATVFMALWVVGWFGFPLLPVPYGPDLFVSYLALLDVVLVFIVIKGDVKLT